MFSKRAPFAFQAQSVFDYLLGKAGHVPFADVSLSLCVRTQPTQVLDFGVAISLLICWNDTHGIINLQLFKHVTVRPFLKYGEEVSPPRRS